MVYHDIGVALGLGPEATKDAYALAKELEGRSGAGRFFLAPPYLPHITLYQGRFVQPTIDRKTLGELCSRIVRRAHWSGEGLALAGYLCIMEGWVFREVVLTRSLREFHEEVAEFLQRKTSANFRDKERALLSDRNTDRLTRERIRRFGGVRTGEEFLPHITIGRLQPISDASRETIHEVRVARGTVHPTKIIAGVIDEHGRMDAGKVFWEKPLAELERRVSTTQ